MAHSIVFNDGYSTLFNNRFKGSERQRNFGICFGEKKSFRNSRVAVNTRRYSRTNSSLVGDSSDGPVLERDSLIEERATEVKDLLGGTSIFFVGMMGSGKKTVGRKLAQALGYCFFDTDEVVQQSAGGASVAQIVQENGEDILREVEGAVIAQLSSMLRLVVATGGGAVSRPANWGHMRDGITVWLDVPVDVLAIRLSENVESGSSRVLSHAFTIEETKEKALDKLSSVFEEKQDLYKPADARISLSAIAAESGKSVLNINSDRVVLQVLDKLRELIERKKMKDAAINY